MSLIPFLDAISNASPAVAVFIIAILALLVAWQALSLASQSVRRDQSNDQ